MRLVMRCAFRSSSPPDWPAGTLYACTFGEVALPPDACEYKYVLCQILDGGTNADNDMVAVPNPGAAAGPDSFTRGDGNQDAQLNIADAIFLLGYLFGGGPAPACLDSADSNDDGKLDVADAISLLGYLFGGAQTLPPPFETCGQDPTDDELDCAAFTPCRQQP